MAQAALPLWRELEDDAGRVLLETTGAVDHGDPDEIGAVAAALDVCGASHELLAPDAASERWPHMRFDRSVVFHPDGGRCLADATVCALQERAAAHGADVRFGTGPASVVPEADSAVVRAGEDEWIAPAVVVTAGAWLSAVAGALVDLPPLVVTHEQVQHFAPRNGADGSAWPSFIHHRRPWVYGLFTPGEGLKVAEHHVGAEIDPNAADQNIDGAAAAAAARYVEQWFPGLDPAPLHAARCLYTTTRNEDFVIDRVGPLVIGSPCSGHGFKFTPLIGRLLADLADGRGRETIGLDQRFALPRAGKAQAT
jgi:sarcosine oxidase